MQGLLSVQILIELQKRLSHNISKYFDWSSGTSTGSFITVLIALETPLKDIRRTYFEFKSKILHGQKPYSTEEIEGFLMSKFGQKKMADISQDVKVLVTATLTDITPPQLYFFRNFESCDEVRKKEPAKNPFNSVPLPKSSEVLIWQACRASGAAPTFFRSYGAFVDGALIANNPTLDTMAEFIRYNASLRYVQRNSEFKKLGLVVSLGAGRWPLMPSEILDVGKFTLASPAESWRTAMAGYALTSCLSVLVTQSDNYVVDRAQAWCHSTEVPYFRISPPLSENMLLDDIDDVLIINALWEARCYAHCLKERFDDLARLLIQSKPHLKQSKHGDDNSGSSVTSARDGTNSDGST